MARMLKRVGRGLLWLLAALLLLAAAWTAWVAWLMGATIPQLDGRVAAPVSADLTVARDAAGVPVITGRTRGDVAYALGYLHGQERFFQMDTLRRAAAGELGALTGGAGLAIDRQTRPHRFRARARIIVARMAPSDRAMLGRYVDGVNAGLGALGHRPWEYGVLLTSPAPWRLEDSILAGFAMYLNLQGTKPQLELDRAVAERRVGRAMADFLFPRGGLLDAALDGSVVAEEPIPAMLSSPVHGGDGSPSGLTEGASRRASSTAFGGPPPPQAGEDQGVPGSNNWAVAGRLSTSGAALVANDMHLGVTVPGTWYRARLRTADGLDASGVTLPGNPHIVQGSNGRIAWAYTNSYIDTSDAVIVEQTRPGFYRTPAGERRIRRVTERLCGRLSCEEFVVEETVWGPIVARDTFGRRIAMQWTAHRADAIDPAAAMAMERVSGVAEAVALARRSAMPQQNFVVGDAAGNIAWMIIGQVPRRVGFDGRDAVSFADGTRGWRGLAPAAEVPVVMNPAGGRIWTANNRVLGGDAFAMLGDGGAAGGERAGRIRDLLFARERFGPRDFLAIQLDDANPRNRWWRDLMLRELEARKGTPRLAALTDAVRRAGDRALPGKRGYWLVADFRFEVIKRLYDGYMGRPDGERRRTGSFAGARAEGPARRLLTARPAALAPGGYADWDAFMDAALDATARRAAGDGEERPGFLSGAFSMAGVHHPLARALPPLGWVTDPADAAVPGETATVRAHGPGFGASQRSAVSPGHEADGVMHIPGSQAGNPRAPYYLAGHRAWVEGRPTPYLPGPARWTLVLTPQ